MRRTVLLAVLSSLALAGSAQAWQPPPTTDEGRLAVYLPIARAAWPDSPCAGREVVHLHADTGAAVEEALQATCEVWMRDGQTPVYFCSTLVHAFGHLAGYGHTDDPDAVHASGRQADVMMSTGGTWPGCLPSPRYLAELQVRDLLPGGGWSVHCTPMTGSPRCRASRPGARDRRFAIDVLYGGQEVQARIIKPRRASRGEP